MVEYCFEVTAFIIVITIRFVVSFQVIIISITIMILITTLGLLLIFQLVANINSVI